MDWPRDNVGVSDVDRNDVFKYVPASSTIITLLSCNQYEPEITSLETSEAWDHYLEHEMPSVGVDTDTGLVLLIAKRMGDPAIQDVKKMSASEWLAKVNDMGPTSASKHIYIAQSFDSCSGTASSDSGPPSSRSRFYVKRLPFSHTTFKIISERFHIHGSIARAVSRANVPVFTSDHIEMATEPAYVYNVRTPNDWENDLALSATHFPRRRLTFAVLYGCSFPTERQVIERLSHAYSECLHPLLMTGILVEVERQRHRALVYSSNTTVESRIDDLDIQFSSLGHQSNEEVEERVKARRKAFRDLIYLKNHLESWIRQLEKISQHATQLNPTASGHKAPDDQKGNSPMREPDAAEAGEKIKNRIQIILGEYDNWIRECNMRAESMRMVTQWAQSETNVEIALATRRDSNHMRSVAVVTMVFLPGTFLATVFSMTFFNWFNDDGAVAVSGYIWIFVVLSVVLTLLTFGLWHCFVISRTSRRPTRHDTRNGVEMDDMEPGRN